MVTSPIAGPTHAARYLQDWARWVHEATGQLAEEVQCLGELLGLILLVGGKVFACGNGGSAGDAAHFVGELVGRLVEERRPAAGIALTGPATVLTALGNDYGGASIFARQLAALASPGDCLLAMSTSGSSPNVLAAIDAAKGMGLLTVALTGPDGLHSSAVQAADLVIKVPLPKGGERQMVTPHVQEVHIAVLHAAAAEVERMLLGQPERQSPVVRSRRQAIFFDRDGTLLDEAQGPVRKPEDLILLPGAAEAVRAANQAGIAVVLVTNQAAVGRGELTAEQLDQIHDQLGEMLAERRAKLDGIYHCPHPAEARCACRKPMPGMILQAAADLHLDVSSSLMIGDTWSDVRAGLAAGAYACLVRTGLGGSAEPLADAVAQSAQHRCLELASASQAVAWLLDGGGCAAAATSASRSSWEVSL